MNNTPIIMAAASCKRKRKSKIEKSSQIYSSHGSGSDADAEEAENIEEIDSETNQMDLSNPESEDRLSLKEGTHVDESEEIKKSGWADAVSKILAKPTGKKILIKASKRQDKDEEEKATAIEKRKQKRDWDEMSRVKPKVTEREFEKSLQRTATRGVVQLFNAVKKQQTTLENKLKDAGPSERKKAKVMVSLTKGDFVDLLKGAPADVLKKSKPDSFGHRSKSMEATSQSSEEREKGAAWNVLQEDFMMSAKMKNWDRESNSDED